MARPRALLLALPALAAGLALAGCSGGKAPGEDLPSGALFLARRAALARVLASAAELAGTPLAREARALAARLPDCEWIEARAQTGAQLADAIACGDPQGPLAALHRARAERDIAFAIPLRADARVIGTASVGAGGDLAISLVLPDDALTGPAAFLLPGPEPAGDPVLSADAALAHARVRAGERLDLAAFVDPESQASRMFRLESELFSGFVLDGTWEAAVYLPESGQRSPRVALALGVRERRAAIAAIEKFIENLRESWPLERSEFALAGASGACLLDLNLLPDLAPCYVATQRALVVGWNPASLRHALASSGGATGGPSELGGAGALVLDFARVQEADARLRALAPSGAELLPEARYPWRSLRMDGERSRAGIELRIELAAKEPA